MKKRFKNLGVINGDYSKLTYVGGSIPYEIRNPSGDWTPHLPVGEKQAGKEDWFDCVSRSLTNSVEIQEKFLTGTESNYCDRELAKETGTTRQGNYLDKVAEYARTTGLGQQTTYPDSGGTFDEQYQVIPAEIKAKLNAEKSDWLNKWEIKYEKVGFDKPSLQYHLKHAPLQVVIPGHAVVNILSLKDVDTIFDSYLPHVKNVPSVYYPGSIIYALKIVLYKKEQALDPDTLFVNLKYGDTGKEILKLKRALKRLWDDREIKEGDVYDNDLSRVVMNYKLANVCDGVWARMWERYLFKGREVDKAVRESINQNLKYGNS